MSGIGPPQQKALGRGNKEAQRVFHRAVKKRIPWVSKRDSMGPLCNDLSHSLSKMSSILYYSIDSETEIPLKRQICNSALLNLTKTLHWKVLCYKNYHTYIIHSRDNCVCSSQKIIHCFNADAQPSYVWINEYSEDLLWTYSNPGTLDLHEYVQKQKEKNEAKQNNSNELIHRFDSATCQLC